MTTFLWRLPSRSPRALAALCGVALGLCFCVPTAHAQPKGKIVVLRSDGPTLKDPERLKVSEDILSQARKYKSFDIIAPAKDVVELLFDLECTEADADCLSRIGTKEGASKVIYSETARGAGGFTLNMRVIDVAQKRVAQTTSQRFGDLTSPTAAIEKAFLVLLGPLDLPPVGQKIEPGTIVLTLAGGGKALVYIDQDFVGTTESTGLTFRYRPGTYTLRVVRAGFKEASRQVIVAAGLMTRLTMTLEAIVPITKEGDPIVPKKDPEPPITKKWWFWTAIGAGVAVVTTVVIIAASSGKDKAPTGQMFFTIDGHYVESDAVFSQK